jgi:hypothetical protein
MGNTTAGLINRARAMAYFLDNSYTSLGFFNADEKLTIHQTIQQKIAGKK